MVFGGIPQLITSQQKLSIYCTTSMRSIDKIKHVAHTMLQVDSSPAAASRSSRRHDHVMSAGICAETRCAVSSCAETTCAWSWPNFPANYCVHIG